MPILAGWTDQDFLKATVEAMLAQMTDLPNIQLKLSEVKGTQYLFQSGSKYYFWNTVTESGAEVTGPTDYNQLLDQMGRDMRGVQVTELPE